MQAARGAALSTQPPEGSPAGSGPADDRPVSDGPVVDGPGGDGPVADLPAEGSPTPASVDAAARPVRRSTGRLLAVAALVLALDVATKVLVVAELEGRRTLELLGGQLLVRVSRNPGAAFSFAEGATLLFTTVAVVVVAVILRVSQRVHGTGWAVALGLLLGGASGNLVDRLLRSPGVGRGAVVDFLDFQVWPSFNVADSAIVTGGLLAVVLSTRGVELDGRQAGDSPRPEDDGA